jgi:hypothetical protein
MACERCEEIHRGQMLGLAQSPCGCPCHDASWNKSDDRTLTSDDDFEPEGEE